MTIVQKNRPDIGRTKTKYFKLKIEYNSIVYVSKFVNIFSQIFFCNFLPYFPFVFLTLSKENQLI